MSYFRFLGGFGSVGGDSRIAVWTDPAAQTSSYSWDESGNLTDNAGTTQVFDERNQLTSAGTTTYDWTDRGTLNTVTTNDGGLQVVEGYIFDALGRTTTSPSASYTYDSLDRIAAADATDFGYAGLEIDPGAIGTSLIARTPAGVPIASKDGTNPGLLLGRNRHGDIGYTHTPAGVVASTTVYDPLGAIAGSTGTALPIGFQGDYTDTSTGDVWMGARWYQAGTGTFASRDTVFGQLSTPMSVNRYTYAYGNPLGMWDPDGREPQCTADIWASGNGIDVCSNNPMDLVEDLTQRSNDLGDRFVAAMRKAVVQTATQIGNMALDLVPGGDCIRGAINVAQGDSVGLGNGVGCALDIVPVVGNAASTVFRYGDDAIEAVHDAGRSASLRNSQRQARQQVLFQLDEQVPGHYRMACPCERQVGRCTLPATMWQPEQMGTYANRTSARRTMATLGLVVSLAACGSGENDSAPIPEPTEASFTLEPSNPEPGETFAATFDPDNVRGGYFTLERWDGNEWTEPAFLLESDVNQPSPNATPISGGFAVLDYGALGPGPDGLVMPDEIENGRWRLCTANAADHVCVQFVVDS